MRVITDLLIMYLNTQQFLNITARHILDLMPNNFQFDNKIRKQINKQLNNSMNVINILLINFNQKFLSYNQEILGRSKKSDLAITILLFLQNIYIQGL